VSNNRRKTLERSLLATAVITLALAAPMASASAASIFDFLFGGGSRSAPTIPIPLPSVRPLGDPSGNMLDGGRENGPPASYCVRLCDGHPFPVQNASSSSAQACASMCPAAQTKVFTGGSIDSAVSSDGKRYSALPTAFVYRKQLVANCTCNGKSAGGLARIDFKSDPTLRPGDIIATNQGLMSYRGGDGRSADFTPVQDRKLSAVQIRKAPVSASAAAANARAEAPPPRKVEEPAAKEGRRRIQVR
jgi:Protein of unknown function (DUF2865)